MSNGEKDNVDPAQLPSFCRLPLIYTPFSSIWLIQWRKSWSWQISFLLQIKTFNFNMFTVKCHARALTTDVRTPRQTWRRGLELVRDDICENIFADWNYCAILLVVLYFTSTHSPVSYLIASPLLHILAVIALSSSYALERLSHVSYEAFLR